MHTNTNTNTLNAPSADSLDVVIYHGNCPDGFTAAYLMKRLNPLLTLIPMLHDGVYKIDLSLIQGKSILFVDFTCPVEIMLTLKDYASSVFVIDHHLQCPDRCNLADIPFIYDVNESGASLVWKTYYPHRIIPQLVDYIKHGDLWSWDVLDNSHEIIAYLHSFLNDSTEWDRLINDLTFSTSFDEMVMCGKAIMRKAKASVAASFNRVTLVKFCEHIVPMMNCTEHISNTGNELCKNYPSSPFSITYFDDLAKNTRHWSLRSIGDYNVSNIAKKMGGGGHKNAAGFSTSLETNIYKFVEKIDGKS